MGWFKITTDTNANATFIKYGVSDSSTAYLLGTQADGTTFNIYNTATDAPGTALTVGTWYHCAMTIAGTGAGQVLGYLNGVLDMTQTGSPGPTNTQICIGAYSTTGSERLNGCAAALKFYTGVFTAAEIAIEMCQYMPFRTAGLVMWSPLLSAADATVNYAGTGVWTVSGTLTTENGPPIPWSLHSSVWNVAVSGGTVYTATLAGAFTPSGALVKVVNKVLQGNTTPVGSVSKRVGKVLSGAVTLSGVLRKTVNKVLSGSVTPIGVLSVALRKAVSLAGALNPIGAVVKRVDKVLSGAVVPVGALTKQVSKVLAGGVALTGVLVKQVSKVLAGIINPIGTLSSNVISGGGQLYTATLSGAVGLSGALTKQINKVLAGTITPVGTVSKVVGKVVSGSVGVSGGVVKGVNKVLSGVVTPIGSVGKMVGKSFSGVVTPVGTLTRSYIRSIVLSGVVTPVGALVSSVIAGSGVVLRTMYPLFRRKRR
jgi:hypothetical protein